MRRRRIRSVAVVVVVQMVLLGLCCMLMPTSLHAMPRVSSADATGCCVPVTENGIRAIAGETVCIARSEYPLYTYQDLQPLRPDFLTVGLPVDPADGVHLRMRVSIPRVIPPTGVSEPPVTHIHFLC